MREEKLKSLFSRYLSGKSRPEEAEAVDRWYEQLQHDAAPLSDEEKQLISSRIEERLRHLESRPVRMLRLKVFIRIAALIVLCTVAGMLLFRHSKPGRTKNIVLVQNSGSRDSLVLLPDGSMISLKPGALIAYPARFARSERRVRILRGAVFFDVARHKGHPFVVHGLSGLCVNVLGTSFRVGQTVTPAHFTVQVASGKVSLSRGGQVLCALGKGQGADYNLRTNSIHKLTGTSLLVIPIRFEGSTLASAVSKLSQIYHVKILISPGVNTGLRTTASFNSGQPLKEILDLLCSLHHLRLHTANDQRTYYIGH